MKDRFFEEAKKESRLSDYDGAHLGAVAVYKDKFILAKAYNTSKTNPTQYFYNRYRKTDKSDIMGKPPRAHAEIQLYRKIRYLDIDFSKVTVYIYRELRDGTMALSAPCKSCRAALHDLGIKNICYTTFDGFIEEKFYRKIK